MLPPETRTRIAKLIPVLSSDKDGEVVAAVRAIGRALAADKQDFHGLARTVAGSRPVIRGQGRPISEGAMWSYADAVEEAEPVGDYAHVPNVGSRKFGLRIDGSGWVASWREVAIHCLKLNKSILRSHGGRFLRDFEINLLEHFRDGKRWPTNAQASWIETVLARCHQARAAAAREAKS